MVSKSRPRDRPLSRRDKVHGKTRPVAPTNNKKEIRKRRKKNGGVKPPAAAATKCVETTADGNNKMSRETGRMDNAVDASPAVIVSTNDRQEIRGGVYKKKPRLKRKGKHSRRLP